MSYKVYIIVAGLIISFWGLHHTVKNESLVTLADMPKGKQPHGEVFCCVTTVKMGIPAIIHKETMKQVVDKADGWKAVGEWWPIIFAVIVVFFPFGCVWGRWGAEDKYCRAAERREKVADQRTKEAEDKLKEIDTQRLANEAVNRENRRILAEAKQIRNEAETLIAEANTRAEIAESEKVAEEQKRKNEQTRHKEDMDKAGARIAELKGKPKKDKDID